MNPTVIPSPVEFSISGTAAFAQAVELAKWYEGELHVAHVAGGRERRPQAEEPGVYAEALARAVSCPTLAVPDGAPLGAKGLFVEILCPMVDLSAASTAALRLALTLAHHSGGRLTLLHVLDGCSDETACSDDATGRLLTHSRVMTRETAAAEAVGCPTGSPGAVEAIILEGRR
jgi:hypothetical protein